MGVCGKRDTSECMCEWREGEMVLHESVCVCMSEGREGRMCSVVSSPLPQLSLL